MPGFAVAAALMILALIVYLAGSRYLPDSRLTRADESCAPATDREERVAHLVSGRGDRAARSQCNVTYTMIWNIGVVWVDQHVDPRLALRTSSGELVQLGRQLREHPRRAGPDCFVGLAGAARDREPARHDEDRDRSRDHGSYPELLLAAGSLAVSDAGKVSRPVGLSLGWFGMGFGFMWYWPIALSLVSKAAPRRSTRR